MQTTPIQTRFATPGQPEFDLGQETLDGLTSGNTAVLVVTNEDGSRDTILATVNEDAVGEGYNIFPVALLLPVDASPGVSAYGQSVQKAEHLDPEPPTEEQIAAANARAAATMAALSEQLAAVFGDEAPEVIDTTAVETDAEVNEDGIL